MFDKVFLVASENSGNTKPCFLLCKNTCLNIWFQLVYFVYCISFFMLFCSRFFLHLFSQAYLKHIKGIWKAYLSHGKVMQKPWSRYVKAIFNPWGVPSHLTKWGQKEGSIYTLKSCAKNNEFSFISPLKNHLNKIHLQILTFIWRQ